MTTAEREQMPRRAQRPPGRLRRLFVRLLGPEMPPAWQDIADDYDGNETEVLEVTAEAFIPSADTEQPFYFFDVGNETILALAGDWLFDPSTVTSEVLDFVEDIGADEWFMNFRLARAPKSGIVFSLVGLGTDIIRAVRRIPAKEVRYIGLSRLFSGTLQTLESDLEREQQKLKAGV